MKKVISLLAVVLIIFSCGNAKKNMIVKGQIKGLKKGTLYLQKMIDTTITTVDSIQLFGDNNFTLTDDITSPEMYYLSYKGAVEDKKLMFFGEKGEITINDNIDQFGFHPEISGSKNQEIMDEFNTINHKFKMRRLDFIKKDFEARATDDKQKEDSLANAYKRMVRNRFLFTTNFAIANKDSEAAPYIALSELFDANIYFLDTINNSLTSRVKSSLYGKRLQKFVSDVKNNE